LLYSPRATNHTLLPHPIESQQSFPNLMRATPRNIVDFLSAHKNTAPPFGGAVRKIKLDQERMLSKPSDGPKSA